MRDVSVDLAWSLDGGRLAFAKEESQKIGPYSYWTKYKIQVRETHGIEVTRLTSQFEAEERWPAWAPDGTRIAFSSNREGNWKIYVMNADGSNQVKVTDSTGSDKVLMWSR